MHRSSLSVVLAGSVMASLVSCSSVPLRPFATTRSHPEGPSAFDPNAFVANSFLQMVATPDSQRPEVTPPYRAPEAPVEPALAQTSTNEFPPIPAEAKPEEYLRKPEGKMRNLSERPASLATADDAIDVKPLQPEVEKPVPSSLPVPPPPRQEILSKQTPASETREKLAPARRAVAMNEPSPGQPMMDLNPPLVEVVRRPELVEARPDGTLWYLPPRLPLVTDFMVDPGTGLVMSQDSPKFELSAENPLALNVEFPSSPLLAQTGLMLDTLEIVAAIQPHWSIDVDLPQDDSSTKFAAILSDPWR